MTDKIILPEDDEAVTPTKRSGWLARGHFYLDEALARRIGSTHTRCSECKEIIPRTGNQTCTDCKLIVDVHNYEEAEKSACDGDGFLYSNTLDIYYNVDVARDKARDAGITSEALAKSLQLYICEAEPIREIDGDTFSDCLFEGEVPDELQEAIDAFNKSIESIPPQLWYPTDIAWNGK